MSSPPPFPSTSFSAPPASSAPGLPRGRALRPPLPQRHPHHPDALRKSRGRHPWREYALEAATHRHGDAWSILVPKARPGHLYAYRIEGPGHDPHQWVLDPYARAVAGHARWGDTSSLHRGFPPKCGAAFPKGVVIEDTFNWGKDAPPRIPQRDLVIYELHVRGYTAGTSSGTAHPGTYRGLADKIPYLRDLGVNAVELLPMFEFNELEYFLANDARASLRNFWGYSTAGFFAPMSRYAHARGRRTRSMNSRRWSGPSTPPGSRSSSTSSTTTPARGKGGPVTSFRGLDPEVWYMLDEQGGYRNYSGCGNTVNANHPVVSDFIVESLRHWVTEFHIDGFRFDLATVLTRGTDGAFLPRPPLIERITEDPVLRDASSSPRRGTPPAATRWAPSPRPPGPNGTASSATRCAPSGRAIPACSPSSPPASPAAATSTTAPARPRASRSTSSAATTASPSWTSSATT
ncbi:MAG: hypothetical protein U1G05_03360 [Kiritimatiellia bacterium]